MSEKELTFEQKLKICELEIQDYVSALNAENRKLQKKIAKYQAENVSLNNRIRDIESDDSFHKRIHESLPEFDTEECCDVLIEIIKHSTLTEQRLRKYLCGN